MINNLLERDKIAKEIKQFVKISNCCNNNCVFCLDSDSHDNTFISSQKVKHNIKQGRKNKATKIIISGGEASINPNFIDYIKYAKELGYNKIQTITNGRYFYYPQFVKEAIAAGLTEITFSLHGHNEEFHDGFTGIKGSFNQVLTGLANVRKYPQIIINIDIVINKLNYKQLYDIILFYAQKFGIYEFDLLQVIPFGQAWKNRDQLFYDIKEALPYLKKVWELAKNDKRFHIWTNRFPAQYLEGYEFLIQHPNKLYDDILGRQKLFENFLQNGRQMICRDKIRCQYCWLNDFCQKLFKLTGGDLNDKLEKLTVAPACLTLNLNKYHVDFLNKKNEIDLIKFINFYINNLYCVKSLRCKKCKQFNNCNGPNINLIRERGFKVLKLIV